MLLSQEELAASAQMAPEVKKFLEAHPFPPTDPNNSDNMKKAVAFMENNLISSLPPKPDTVTETTHNIRLRDDYESSLLIFRPSTAQPGPLVILLHAGGFVAGSSRQVTPEARALVHLFGATVVSVSFRLAPEFKFPTPQLDVWDSCKWIASNATGDLLRSDPSKGFILGGASVGGSMTGALSRKFQDELLAHPLTGQWMGIPSLMDDSCVPVRPSRHIGHDGCY
jgi:acetyl esterase/lipase